MKALLAGLAAVAAVGVRGADLRLTFDRIDPARHTVAGYGRTMRQGDRAVVLAVRPDPYLAQAAPNFRVPAANQVFALDRLPASGYLELYAMPFFTAPGPFPLAALRQGGDEVVKLVLDEKFLTVVVAGKSAKISVAGWAPRHYRHIQLVWRDGVTRIFLDRRECGLIPTAPEAAGQATLFAAFQGLADEFSVGAGMPRTIDPEFDGDPARFPEIRPEGEANWRAAVPELRLTPRGDRLRCEWPGFGVSGKLGAAAVSLQEYPVRAGACLRADLGWTKLRWEYGAQMWVRLVFTDAGGKVVRRQSIDGRSDIPGYVFPMTLSEFLTEAGIGVPMRYFNYIRVPAGALKMHLEYSFYGNAATVELGDFRLRYVDPGKQPWFREPYDIQKVHSAAALTPAEVEATLKRRERLRPELRKTGDRVELFLNGKRVPTQIFVNPAAGDCRWLNDYDPANFPLVLVNVSLGRSASFTEYDPIWKEDGSIDIGPLVAAVRRVIRYRPDAAVMLGLSITPPRSWLEAHREELMVNRRGEYAVMRDFAVRGLYSREFPNRPGHTWYPSTASVKYRRDVAAVLKRALGEFERTDAAKAVMGIYVLGGDDGQFRFPPLPDFSAPALRSWREFLRARGRPDAATAAMPDPAEFRRPPFPAFGDSPIADYQKWSTLESYSLRRSMYDAVKSAMPRALVGGYENAMGLTGQPGFGRYKIGELLRHAVPDFLVSLPGYNRYRDDCDHPSGMKAYNGSAVLHGKLMIGEMDIRNPENGPLGINNRSRNYQATHNADTFRNFLALYAAYCVSWGGGFHAYLMQPMWWNTDRAVAAWNRAAAIARQAEGQPLTPDRIAVMTDENSSYCHSTADIPAFHSRIHYRESTQYALWRSGVRCDYFLPEDVLHPDFAAPKILIFADAGTMTPDFAAMVREKWGRDGRVIVWIGHAGYLNAGSVEAVSRITGFQLKKLDAMPKPLVRDGKLLWEPAFYAGNFPAPVFAVTDPAAEILAVYAGTRFAGLARKKYTDHTEIYLGQPGSLAPGFVRELARSVGIRPVQDRNDLAVMGGGLLEIGAMTGPGVRRISFPNGVRELQLLTGKNIVRRGADFIEVDLPYKDAAVFRMIR